jgi:DNA-binding NarL/FixJ family response regulator
MLVVGSSTEKAAGRLPADASARQIDAALRAVAAGLTVRDATRQSPNLEPLPEEAAAVLTPREIDILTALGKGLSNKAAARRFGISPHTVKFHVDSLFRKLGAASRAEAVAKGLKQQIVEL